MAFRLRPLHEDKLHFADLSNTQILILALRTTGRLWQKSQEYPKTTGNDGRD